MPRCFHNKKWRKRKMRDLEIDELELVSGGGGCAPPPNCGKPDAKPCGPQGNNGFGNGGHDGVPGHSDFQDDTR
jgi:hypothetical protein